MKKKICIIFSLFLSCLLLLTPVGAKTNINDMTIQAYINEDGSAHIQEVWDMNVDEGTEVYKIFNKMGKSKISGLKVRDENGLEYQNIGKWNVDASRSKKSGKCGLVTKSDGYELCFGVGEYGHRTYTFEYDISNFVKQYTADQGVNFAFFSDLAQAPKHAKITLSSPYLFNKDNSQIWAFGYNGQVVFNDGQVVMETSGSVSSKGKMQLLMRIDNGTFKKASKLDKDFADVLADAKKGSSYSQDEGNISTGALIGILAAVFAIITLVVFIIAYAVKSAAVGRRVTFKDGTYFDKKNKDINMFRDIPCHKDTFEFYYLAKKTELITELNKDGMIAAILLKWVQKGYIEFEKTQEDRMIFFKKEGFSIDLNRNIVCDSLLEEKLLSYFVEAAGSNKRLETKEFDKWCSKNYTKIEKWFESIETAVENDYRQRGLLTLGTVEDTFLKIKFKKNVDVYDLSLKEEMEHVVGLKKFLEEMSLIDEKEVIEVKMWEYYLIFASILGIADKVEEQLGRLCPTFNQQSHMDTYYTTRMVHMFAYSSMQSSRSAAQAAASSGYGGGSSFGGGGGGFSGGGGGGVR